MGILFIIMLISILIVAIIVLPIVFFIIGRSRKWSWLFRLSSLIPLIIAIFFLSSYFGANDYYYDEYRIITETDFPRTGKIIYSTSTNISFNGDHTSAFLVELDFLNGRKKLSKYNIHSLIRY